MLIAAHIEVDTYGFIIMKELGYEKPQDVLKFMATFEGNRNESRLAAAVNTISYLWSELEE